MVIWGGFFFFISLLQYQFSENSTNKILGFIVPLGFIQGVIGLGQVVFQQNWVYWLPPALGLEVMFQQINNQATFQVTAIICAFYLVSKIDKIRNVKLFSFSTVVFLAAIVVGLSGSRIGALGLFLAIVIIFVALKFSPTVLKKTKLNVMIVAAVGEFKAGFEFSDEVPFYVSSLHYTLFIDAFFQT